jgi:hypothetical protein
VELRVVLNNHEIHQIHERKSSRVFSVFRGHLLFEQPKQQVEQKCQATFSLVGGFELWFGTVCFVVQQDAWTIEPFVGECFLAGF